MIHHIIQRFRFCLLLGLLVLPLSLPGCGKKGDLEAPAASDQKEEKSPSSGDRKYTY